VQFPLTVLIKTYNCFCFIKDYLFCTKDRFKVQGSPVKFAPLFSEKNLTAQARFRVNSFCTIRTQAKNTGALSRVPLLILPILLFLVPWALCLGPDIGHAADVTVGWDKCLESNIAGYKIHYGTSSGNYEFSVDVGNYTSCTISGLSEGQTYYFAANSYNTDKIESVLSTELIHTVPASEPDIPASEPDILASEPDIPGGEPDVPALETSTTPTDGGEGTKVTTTFSPVADATVSISRPAQNYGSRSYLEVDASSEKISYLRFSVNGLNGTVVSARIQLECINASSFGGTIYGISDTSWQERTVTWDNQPGIDGLAQDALGAVSVGDIVELDVTAVVTGNGTYNFAMDSNHNNGADYYAREGLNPPVLIISTAAAEATAGRVSAGPADTVIEEARILIEAEDAQIYYPFEYGRDGEASSDGFIWVPERGGNVWNSAEPGGYAEFSFEVPQTGNYVIWGRILASNGKNNSFFVSMDDGSFYLWSTVKSKKWVWDQVSSQGGADPVVFYLEAGEHTLTIKQRDDGTKLDKIMITNNLGYVPEGPGD